MVIQMLNLVNFDNYGQNQRMYGGTAGRKMGICYEGENYILKFPSNLKEQQMKNINLSYSNSPVCEYIGSKIYEILGFDVHQTILGTRNGKTVVACKDFLEEGDRLYEFEKIKVTFEPHFLDSNGNETNGVGVDLYEIIMTIKEHPIFSDMKDVELFFWEMFVTDAWIGNPDRNNSNWGIIIKRDGTKALAPVYDNGNCFNCKWDDAKMEKVLEDGKSIQAEAFSGRRCIFELNRKRVNPYYLIESGEYDICNRALERLVPRMQAKLPYIEEMIDEIPVLSDVQKKFYKIMLKRRLEKIFMPTYQKMKEQDIGRNEREGRCR